MGNKIYSKVFLWMFIGLLITFATGYIVSTNENILYNVFSKGTYFILIIIELVLVIVLSAKITKMKTTTARIIFILYSFITGLTFGSIFVAYKITSIITIFLIAAILFGLFAILGYISKIDLTKFSTYLFMVLLGMIICIVINMIVKNSVFDLLISCISLVIFLGFTAYDIQKIKKISNIIDNEDNFVIIGALELYLDFINIFLDLLRLFGNSRD